MIEIPIRQSFLDDTLLTRCSSKILTWLIGMDGISGGEITSMVVALILYQRHGRCEQEFWDNSKHSEFIVDKTYGVFR